MTTPTPTILEATVDDAAELITYLAELYAETDNFNPVSADEFNPTVDKQKETISSYASQKNSIYLLAIMEQQIVGELSLKGYPFKDLQHNATLGISVHREWRRRGIGRALLAEGIAWAKRTELIKRIELYTFATNLAAQGLYRHFGFVKEGVRKDFVYQNGAYIDDVMMALYL